MTTTDAMTTTAEARCWCSDTFDLTDAEHAWLTTVEERGLAGFVELLNELEARHGNESVEGELHFTRLEEFVAAHNWQRPDLMTRLSEVVYATVRAAWSLNAPRLA